MDPFEVKHCLNSLRVVVDSREQQTDRAKERYQRFEVPWERAHLDFGDYTYNYTMPDGLPRYDISDVIHPKIAIERKMNLDELAGCFVDKSGRFAREFQRATEHGAKIYLLVENASWEQIIAHKYKSRLHPNSFRSFITAYMARYNLSLIFCKSETTGGLIKEILYRELKEDLENGGFG